MGNPNLGVPPVKSDTEMSDGRLPMVREAVVATFLGLIVCFCSAGPAFGERDEQDVEVSKRLKDIERELIDAREQGNDAEVAEIETLMEQLEEAAVDGDNRDGDRADMDDEGGAVQQERLRELERELKLTREAGNELEVDEIRELMARLTSRIRDEEISTTPHVNRIEVNIDSVSNVRISSAACGFALAYSGTAKSQLAVMEPAGILVGSVATDGIITVVASIARVDKAFQIRAVAEVWDGRGAEVSFSFDKSNTSWHRLGNAPTPLEVNDHTAHQAVHKLGRR